LGGLISSTATTVSYARRAKTAPAAHSLALTVILIASAVSYLRVLIEVSIFASSNLGTLVPPLASALVWVTGIAAAAFVFLRNDHEPMPSPANPAELKSALVFGVIYAVITLVAALIKERFGATGLYGVALISGLTDMDAITLSLARMVESRQLDGDTGWRIILAASLSNFVFKGVAAGFLGGWQFGLRLAPFFIAALLGGLALILFWPHGFSIVPPPSH
jgi:uncharacterized membrane protein (DUF4010 family)